MAPKTHLHTVCPCIIQFFLVNVIVLNDALQIIFDTAVYNILQVHVGPVSSM